MDPHHLLGFGSALPLAALGIGLLFMRPRRSPQVFFGLFLVIWALQLGLMNIGYLLGGSETIRLTILLGSAAQIVSVVFLVHFAMVVHRRPGHQYVTGAAIGIALAAGTVLALRPDLVLASVSPRFEWGSLNFLLFTVPQRLAFFLALIVMYFEYRQAKAGTPRRRLRGILIAFALILSYGNVQFLAFWLAQPGDLVQFASHAVGTAGGVGDVILLLVLFLLTFATIGLVVHLIVRPPPPEGVDNPLVFAFIFPATVAILELALDLFVDIQFETRGFWQILAAGVIVYTLANYHLFDLELKVKRFIGPLIAGVLLLFGVPILLTLALGEFGTESIVFALIPQVIGVAGIVVFQDRVKSALFPGVSETPDYVHQRKMDIYRVALEETMRRGGSTDDPALNELRLRHGITQQEHSIIAWMVSSEHRRTQTGEGEKTFAVGQTVLDRYRLDRTLGDGTYGRTFLAFDHRSRREVALKTVGLDAYDGAAARLLLREARLAATIDHPYVIDILDVAELPDRVVVVMEYADSGNLEDHLERHGAIPLSSAVRFLRELLMALEAVHEKGIVHRNMKPKNILLEADGSVRLSDFGAAVSETQKSTQKTELATKTLQDLLYQSPEQMKGQEATAQSDLFVAGILFHTVLTRRHPFPIAGKDDHRIRQVVTTGRLELQNPTGAGWVDQLLSKALAMDPADRYADAGAMRAELEAWAGLGGGAAAKTTHGTGSPSTPPGAAAGSGANPANPKTLK